MSETAVTIIITQRDRFCFTQENLETIYKNTDIPFELVYVDGGSPGHIRDYLVKSAQEKKFELIRVDHYLTPNQARNIALKHVKTPYVVYVENDVVVSSHWLSAMISCIEETGCALVCPLTCQDKPIHENIHYSGGEMEIKEEIRGGNAERFISESMFHKQGSKYSEINPPLQRGKVGFTEVHCFLVRLDILKKIKGFDEGVMSTRDHVDFSLNVRTAGGTIYFEPKSIITFMGHFTAPKLQPWEEDFFKLRWSDAWELNSLKYLSRKWKLTENKYFKNRYRTLGWRRRLFLIKPKIKHIKPRFLRRMIEEVLVIVDKAANYMLTRDFAKKYGQD